MKALLYTPTDTGIPGLLIAPGSAILTPRRPFFPSAHAVAWQLQLYLGVRLCRLGKYVEPRFAHRYYDAVMPCLRLIPADTLGADTPLAAAMDGTFMVTPETSVSEDITDIVLEGITVTPHYDYTYIDTAVADISRYVTLQTGDILALPLRCPPLDVGPRADLHLLFHHKESTIKIR